MTNIYLITNLVTKQQYVGKTKYSIEHRFEGHCCDTNNTYIDCAIKKYGKSNFSVALLLSCEDDEWPKWEAHFIEVLHTHWTEGGYNLSRGGDHNPMEDPEVRRRHLVACQSESHREKQRIASTGKHHTAESREKMSKIQREIYSDPVLRQKVKLNQPARFPVQMLDDSGNVVKEFVSLNDACRYLGKRLTDSGGLREAVDRFNKNGTRSRFWGYSWTAIKDKV